MNRRCDLPVDTLKIHYGTLSLMIIRPASFLISALSFGRACTLGLAILTGQGLAEEGGSGHYLPGSMASFVDGLPLSETVVVRYNLVHYAGSADANLSIPIGGSTAAGLDAETWAHGLTFLWRPPIEVGERFSYSMSATVPYVFMDVTASAATGPIALNLHGKESGLGDIVLMPLMLNYNINPDCNINGRIGIYAPTGDYQTGRLANTGKNFWTIEPTLGAMYFGRSNGREASVFVGIDFNTENHDTNYHSGTSFHVDGTLAQHFPLFEGLAGVGVSAFTYYQIAADSGDGAIFGDFKGNTNGVGPALSFVMPVNGNVIAELKWLHEYAVQNRLEGDTVFLKVVFKL